MDGDEITDILLLRDTVFPVYTERETRVSMSPSVGDVAQIPEPKSKTGFASVFKSLTGNKSSPSPNPQSPAQLNSGNALQPMVYGGPPNYEQLYGQIKAGNPLADRLSAAASLRHAVQDYPLSGVFGLNRCVQILADMGCR